MQNNNGRPFQIIIFILIISLLSFTIFTNSEIFLKGYYSIPIYPLTSSNDGIIDYPSIDEIFKNIININKNTAINIIISIIITAILSIVFITNLVNKVSKETLNEDESTEESEEYVSYKTSNNIIIVTTIIMLLLIVIVGLSDSTYLRIPRILCTILISMFTLVFPPIYQKYLKKINKKNQQIYKISLVDCCSIYSNFGTIYGCIYYIINFFIDSDGGIDTISLVIALTIMICFQIKQVLDIYRNNFLDPEKIIWLNYWL